MRLFLSFSAVPMRVPRMRYRAQGSHGFSSNYEGSGGDNDNSKSHYIQVTR